MRARCIILTCLFFLVAHDGICQRGDKPGHEMPPPPAKWNDIPAPVVPPGKALATFELTDPRLRLELIAAEPLVEDPVAIAYDADGRAWVAEMRGFMPDVHGKGEENPVGNIVILTDTDADGAYDDRKVFLDNLVLPRALAHAHGGLLYADHSTLYFVPIERDLAPGTPKIVDADYAPKGAVEHKPNGLLRALDNWIYCAKSDKRYRRIEGEWIIEPTEFRGQWGISQDDYGRLLTNTNSNLANLELLPPGATIRNPAHEFRSKTGANTPTNKVYPIRPTPGVNRGYMYGMLDERGRLTRATAACGPAVYRGDNFPEEFYGDIFVPEPAGLLLKHVRVEQEGCGFDLDFAHPDKEFLASTDERSRIVNAYTAPDGSLHLVDFYRGILQHKLYITTYLHNQILHRGLDKHLGRGRIYRVVNKEKETEPPPPLSKLSPAELVPHLAHPNGWVRDTAQRLLVESGDHEVVPALQKTIATNSSHLARIHALWTLEGLRALTPADLAAAVTTSSDPRVLAQVVRLAATFAGQTGSLEALAVLGAVDLKSAHPLVTLHLALYLGPFEEPAALDLLSGVLARHPGDKLLLDAALSGLGTNRETFLARNPAAAAYVKEIAERRKPKKSLVKTDAEKAQYALGKLEYEKLCLACHQAHGRGQNYLAPPLARSEWVEGKPEVLARILLDGMSGPVHVDGKKYDAPNIQPLMPGLRHVPDLTDEKLAAILTYIRNSWGNAAKPVSPKTVSNIRANTPPRQTPYTERELKVAPSLREGSPSDQSLDRPTR